jgi:hypothetical protein
VPRLVSHKKTYRWIIRDSSRLRQGRGGRPLARAFSRFRIDDSCEGIDPPLPLGLAELPAFFRYRLGHSKGLSSTTGNRWQIIFLTIHATSRALLQKLFSNNPWNFRVVL